MPCFCCSSMVSLKGSDVILYVKTRHVLSHINRFSNCISHCWKDRWLLVCLNHLWISFYAWAQLHCVIWPEVTALIWRFCDAWSSSVLLKSSHTHTQHKHTHGSGHVRKILWRMCKLRPHNEPQKPTDLSVETVFLKEISSDFMLCCPEGSSLSAEIRSFH